MIQDYSYGIIPLMQRDGIRYTILVHLSSGDHRGLPKWHAEAWETQLQSAIRELGEETGLQISEDQVNIADIHTEQYIFSHPKKPQDIQKIVQYYTAILPYTDITILWGYSESDGEIINKKLVTIDEAISLATYENTRTILQQVKESL